MGETYDHAMNPRTIPAANSTNTRIFSSMINLLQLHALRRRRDDGRKELRDQQRNHRATPAHENPAQCAFWVFRIHEIPPTREKTFSRSSSFCCLLPTSSYV